MKPAFLYFALSKEESLHLDPYNTPAALLREEPIDVYSWDLPGHGPGFDKMRAMHYWAEQGPALLTDFFDRTAEAIEELVAQEKIDPKRLAIGGLSRGGFVAAHIAARCKAIKTLVGFAPVTTLSCVEEFSDSLGLDLVDLIPQLSHLEHMRFLIGTRDERVSTDACYHFIRSFAEAEPRKEIELHLSPSIGIKGHGTSPEAFASGMQFIKTHLLGEM